MVDFRLVKSRNFPCAAGDGIIESEYLVEGEWLDVPSHQIHDSIEVDRVSLHWHTGCFIAFASNAQRFASTLPGPSTPNPLTPKSELDGPGHFRDYTFTP